MTHVFVNIFCYTIHFFELKFYACTLSARAQLISPIKWFFSLFVSFQMFTMPKVMVKFFWQQTRPHPQVKNILCRCRSHKNSHSKEIYPFYIQFKWGWLSWNKILINKKNNNSNKKIININSAVHIKWILGKKVHKILEKKTSNKMFWNGKSCTGKKGMSQMVHRIK